MYKEKNRKNEILIIGLILLLIIALIGVSYAAFRFTGEGTKVNTITTGSITMSYTESDNTISLNGALPTTDKTGMVRLNDGEYFDFTVSSKIVGNVNINYEISAKEIGDGTIDGSNIKLYLTRLTEDGEEALMVPETYNEEITSNNYTGRPAGEMSLYTSSMSSSESNNYRLRMYVDERYNPQGDGGGLTFNIKINVYGKDGDKYVPPTTQEILEDSELQTEKTSMFNYASNGSYVASFTVEGPQYGSEPSQVTNGLYSMNDEDGVSYYYRGAVENNNVQFGEYESDYYVYNYVYNYTSRYFQSLESCQEYNSSCSESNRVKLASAGDKMYWKIIRVNGDGSLRLIYNGTSANPDNSDLANSYLVGMTTYNLEYNDPKYVGYTYDNGIDSFIKKEVDTWYKNTLGKTSYDSKVLGGRFCSDSSGYKSIADYDNLGSTLFPPDTYYFASMGERLGQFMGNYAKDNAPTLKCPATTESYGGSYRLKAGLITADELALAGESAFVVGNSYLNPGNSEMDYWSMTPAAFYNSYAGVWDEFVLLRGGNGDVSGLRPVISVTTNNGFTSGDGTTLNPYVIS